MPKALIITAELLAHATIAALFWLATFNGGLP